MTSSIKSQHNFENILEKFEGLQEHDGYWTAFCPAHDNKNTRSLSIAIKDDKLLVHCFGAGCSGEQIAAAIGVPISAFFQSAPNTASWQPLTISELAYHKKLPPEFMAKFVRELSGPELKDKFNVGRGKEKYACLQIVYKDMAGCETTCQQRFRSALHATDGSYWDKLGINKPTMFGLWLVPSFTQDYLIMPEGETNAITLWYHNQPALSFPGATMAGKLQRDHISKFKKIYVCYDKDTGGDTLIASLPKQLQKINYRGQVFVVTFPEGCKDVSDLHCKYLETFDQELQKCLDTAVSLKEFLLAKQQATGATQSTDTTQTDIIKTIPVSAHQYYEVTSKGVFLCAMEKDFTTDQITKTTQRICADPVYISERLVDIFHATSQVRLIIRYSANNEKSFVVPTTCLSGTDMKVLTDMGLRILTPNGSDMAKYFLACLNQLEEASNFASRNGWLNRKYTQFILGQTILEADKQTTIARYTDDSLDISTQGDHTTWLDLVKKYFKNPYIAFAMSASAASFLAAALGIDGSILHFFGDSSVGKSTATMFAASLWGQPVMMQDRSIRKNWSGTAVGIETYCEQMNNLCCFLEDSNDAKDDDTISRIAQAFVNGAGKPRGTVKKGVGVVGDRSKTWQTILMSTGEKKISDSSSMGGVAARTMEVEVKKIENYRQSEFQTMRTVFASNFGFGIEIIRHWFNHADEIRATYTQHLDWLEDNFSKIEDKKKRCLCSLALIMTGLNLLQDVFGLKGDLTPICNEIMQDSEPKGSKGVYETLVEHYVSNSTRFGTMQPQDNGEHTYIPSADKDELGVYYEHFPITQKQDGKKITEFVPVVCFYIDKLKIHLAKHKFSASQIGLLKKDGLLVTSSGHGNRYGAKLNGAFVRFYAIILQTCKYSFPYMAK